VALATAELLEIIDATPVVAVGGVVAAIAGDATAIASTRIVAASPLASLFIPIPS
jgi:uncharacterized Zn-binding protein involved in type VI secretion